jgi:hypothetical protein
MRGPIFLDARMDWLSLQDGCSSRLPFNKEAVEETTLCEFGLFGPFISFR